MLTTSALPSAVLWLGCWCSPGALVQSVFGGMNTELFDLSHESWWSHTKHEWSQCPLCVWEGWGSSPEVLLSFEGQSNSKWFMGLFSILPLPVNLTLAYLSFSLSFSSPFQVFVSGPSLWFNHISGIFSSWLLGAPKHSMQRRCQLGEHFPPLLQ